MINNIRWYFLFLPAPIIAWYEESPLQDKVVHTTSSFMSSSSHRMKGVQCLSPRGLYVAPDCAMKQMLFMY